MAKATYAIKVFSFYGEDNSAHRVETETNRWLAERFESGVYWRLVNVSTRDNETRLYFVCDIEE